VFKSDIDLSITKNTNTILLHLTGCVLFLFFALIASPDWPYPERTFINPMGRTDIIFQFELLLFFYLNYYFLLDKFYFQGRQFIYFGILILFVLIAIPVMEHFVIHSMPRPDHDHPRPPGPPGKRSPLSMFLFNRKLYLFLLIVAGSILIKLRNRLRKTEREKTVSELSFLKAQINPHFLFNTLNSIYSLAIQRSDATPDAVVKLSGMMRYVLQDAQHETVSLQSEVNYIKDYIELQKLRLDKSVKLIFTQEGDLTGKKIAPLILISFIENAFKYGVNSEEDSEIVIKIKSEKEFSLFVKNNKVRSYSSDEPNTGLGIKNTRKRLELLYPGLHTLEITDNEKEFSVNLVIRLK
jgi:two-component sensor histidine kinase